MQKNIRINLLMWLVICLPIMAIAQTNTINNKNTTQISGNVNLDDKFEAVLVFDQSSADKQEDLTVSLDSLGNFSWHFNIDKPTFLKFTIYPKARDRQLALNFPMYILPGSKNVMNLHYNDSTFLSLEKNNLSRANKALLEYSNFRYLKMMSLFVHPPSKTETQSSIEQYLSTAKRLIKKERVKKEKVENYLMIWAMNDYIENMQKIKRSNNDYAYKLTAADFDFSKKLSKLSPVKIYNHSEALLFSSVYFDLNEYMRAIDTEKKEGSTFERIEQHLKLFNSRFSNQGLRDLYNYGQLNDYVNAFKVSATTDFDAQKQKFEQLVSMIKDETKKEALITAFSNLTYIRQGAPMPNVVFKDVNGNDVPLKSFVGKYLYIDLWASWCGPCIKQIPDLKKLEAEYKDKNIVFLSISVDASKEDWMDKMKELGLTGHQLEVGKSAYEKMMKIKGIPHFILYDKTGKLLLYDAPRPGTLEIRNIFNAF